MATVDLRSASEPYRHGLGHLADNTLRVFLHGRALIPYWRGEASSKVMAKPKIVLFVDIASPFCYMAFHVLQVSIYYCPVSEMAGLTLEPRCRRMPMVRYPVTIDLTIAEFPHLRSMRHNVHANISCWADEDVWKQASFADQK